MKYDGNGTFDKDGNFLSPVLGEYWSGWPKARPKPDYQISNLGRVRRISAEGWQLLKHAVMPNGDITIGLVTDEGRKTYMLKRLVAEVWVDNDKNEPDVLLKNGIKSDLRIGNLAWYDWRAAKKSKKQFAENILQRVRGLDIKSLERLDQILNQLEE
tara:strand:- start:5 stop:475 length:471 start_codon:yes stop_codon:yes gene_type:complete